jgi:hypothetical protein
MCRLDCCLVLAFSCALLLLSGCSNSEPSPEGVTDPPGEAWSAEREKLGKQLADVGLTLPYIRSCLGGNQAIAVVVITEVRDHGGGFHTDTIRQCHFRALDVLRPGSDEEGGSIWNYSWFAHAPRPGWEEKPLAEGATVLVVLDFNVTRWPEGERVVPVDGPDDPRVGELKALIKEELARAHRKRKPWDR